MWKRFWKRLLGDEASKTDRIVAVATVVIAASTIVQCVVIYLQLKEMEATGVQTNAIVEVTKKQADAADKISKAADKFQTSAAGINTQTTAAVGEFQRMAGASEQNIRAVQESSRVDERAWMSPLGDHRFTEDSGGGFHQALITVKNVGKTPALDVRASANALVLHPNETPTISFSEPGIRSTKEGAVHPQGGREVWVRFKYPAGDSEVVKQLRSGDLVLYFFAEITYNDIFGRLHFTHVCVRFDKDLVAASSCDTYNDAN